MTNLADRLKLLVTGAIVAGACIGYAICGRDDLNPKWGGMVIQTLLLFGYLLSFNRSLRSRLRFWQVFISLFLLHCVVYIFVLLRIDRFGLVWFVIPAVAETLVYQSLIERLCLPSDE